MVEGISPVAAAAAVAMLHRWRRSWGGRQGSSEHSRPSALPE